jgi:hypothetical protein
MSIEARTKKLMGVMILSAVVGLPVQASSQSATAPDKALRNVRVEECLSTRKDANSYCECIVQASNDIDDNDPLLNLFLYSLNEAKAKEIYDKIIYGDTYNKHNFSSVQEKKDYVAGRATLFVRRIKMKCGARE